MTSLHTATPSVTKPNPLKMAAVLGFLTALAPLSIDMYLPALPKISNDYHSSTSFTQLSLTMCLIGLALGQLLAGPLSDARGRRTPLRIGIAVYILASLMCAVAPNMATLILLRFVQGLSGAAGIVIARAVARDLFSGTELTRFFALLMLVNGAAPILAPIIGGQLLRVTSWHGVFVVLGVLGVGMFLAVTFGLKETHPPERRTTGGIRATLHIFRRLITDRSFMSFALSQGLVSAAMFGYISGSPFVLQDVFHLSPQMFSLCFAINGVGIILGGQISGRLAGRINQKKLFVFGICLAATGALALLVTVLSGGGLSGVLPSLFLVVSSVGIVSTIGSSLAMQSQAKAAGSASALIGVAQQFLGAIASPLVGLGGSHTAMPMGIVIAAADVGSLVWFTVMSALVKRPSVMERGVSM